MGGVVAGQSSGDGAVSADRGESARDGDGDVPPRAGHVPLKKKAHPLGVLSLILTFAGLSWLVLAYVGVSAATVSGFEIGTFLGLLSLAIELILVERDEVRTNGDPSQAVFASFFLRLAIVGPFTMWFGAMDVGIHAEAFALSYLSTFFVYLCWLTWKVATAPVHYKGGGVRIDSAEFGAPKRSAARRDA